jgi:hypothetical protein
MMTDEERQKRMESLYNAQNNIFGGKALLSAYKPEQLALTQFPINDFSFEIPVFENMEKMDEMDESVFADWKIADIPVMVAAGGLGTLSSVLLRDFFDGLHSEWGIHSFAEGGHSGENIDWVPGAKQPGGFGHRWKFGHDILNPFEVDWEQYKEIASGGFLPSWLKAPFIWLRHLLQDTFSKEGLPIPGNSLLRFFLNPADPKTREVLQILGTIKMRDIAGAGITNVLMGAYVWGTEKDFKRVICKPNYRGFSLMLGANFITLLSGLLVPPPATSFNWGTIPAICYYSYQLIKLEKEVRRQLKVRDDLLERNQAVIFRNNETLKNTVLMNDDYYNEFLKYENEIVDFNKRTIAKHETLKKRLMPEGV